MEPVRQAPLIPWERLRTRLASDWQAGQHITLIGPNGSGKTHMALELLELCAYRLVLATKRQDPLVAQLRQDGYVVTSDLAQIQWTFDEGARRAVPVQRKVVFWPVFPDKMGARQRIEAQAALMRKALDWADKTGGWAVLVDETMWMTKNLKLERELDALWFQGRTQGLSVLANAQRPSHVPRLAYSQATYIFIWQTSDHRDIENLREISAGIPRELIEGSVRALDFHSHEALFIDVRNKELARVIAPAR